MGILKGELDFGEVQHVLRESNDSGSRAATRKRDGRWIFPGRTRSAAFLHTVGSAFTSASPLPRQREFDELC